MRDGVLGDCSPYQGHKKAGLDDLKGLSAAAGSAQPRTDGRTDHLQAAFSRLCDGSWGDPERVGFSEQHLPLHRLTGPEHPAFD